MQALRLAGLILVAFAQFQIFAAVELKEVGVWPRHKPGPVYNQDVSTGKAYLAASEGGLIILDVANPADPKYLGSIETAWDAFDVAVRGDVAFVSASLRGIEVFDVSDPSRPKLISKLISHLGDYMHGLHLVNNTLYAAWEHGLDIIDASDPTDLKLLGHWESDWYSLNVFVQGSLAYICDIWGLYIVDVSDPTAPRRVGSYRTGTINSVASYWQVRVRGNYAYAATSIGLEILDVSDPANVRKISGLPEPIVDGGGFANSVQLAGDVAYVNASGVGERGGLRGINIADPAHPFQMSRLETSQESGYFVIKDNVAYLAEGKWGMRTVSLSDTLQPRKLGLFRTYPGFKDVAVANGHLFLTDAAVGGVNVVDYRDRANPTLVSVLETRSAAAVATTGNRLYVNGEPGVHVFDIANPARPVEIGLWQREGSFPYPVDLDLSGNFAYASFYNELSIFDISTPGALLRAGRVDIGGGYIMSTTVKDGLAFLSVYDTDFRILDVRDPANVKEVARYPANSPRSITLDGNFGYFVEEFSGVSIMDLSVPAKPTEIGRYPVTPTNRPQHFAVSGRYGFLSRETSLDVLDLKDPSKPALVGGISGPSGRIIFDGDTMFAVNNGRLRAYEISVAPKLSVELTGGSLNLSWEADFPEFKLQQSGDLEAWEDAPSGPSAAAGGQRFYRLIKR